MSKQDLESYIQHYFEMVRKGLEPDPYVTDEPTCFTDEDGSQHWYLHGQLHREDGPALIHPDGTIIYYKYGRYHREGGPAYSHPNGTQYWFINGEYHREDGPAVVFDIGGSWYLNGRQYSLEDWLETRDWSDAKKLEFYLKWK